MPPYTATLFDLDGTLTNPRLGITKSVRYALIRLGLEAPDLDALTKFIGPPLRDSFEQFYHLSRADAERAVAAYREYFEDVGIYENALLPGVAHLLRNLREADRLVILATSKPTIYSERILERFNVRSFFTHVVGSNLDGTMTDKAEIIAQILTLHAVPPATRCVMVGDREHDIIGARAHGMDSIGVTCGFGSDQELRSAGATYIAQSMTQVHNILLSDGG